MPHLLRLFVDETLQKTALVTLNNVTGETFLSLFFKEESNPRVELRAAFLCGNDQQGAKTRHSVPIHSHVSVCFNTALFPRQPSIELYAVNTSTVLAAAAGHSSTSSSLSSTTNSSAVHDQHLSPNFVQEITSVNTSLNATSSASISRPQTQASFAPALVASQEKQYVFQFGIKTYPCRLEHFCGSQVLYLDILHRSAQSNTLWSQKFDDDIYVKRCPPLEDAALGLPSDNAVIIRVHPGMEIHSSVLLHLDTCGLQAAAPIDDGTDTQMQYVLFRKASFLLDDVSRYIKRYDRSNEKRDQVEQQQNIFMMVFRPAPAPSTIFNPLPSHMPPVVPASTAVMQQQQPPPPPIPTQYGVPAGPSAGMHGGMMQGAPQHVGMQGGFHQQQQQQQPQGMHLGVGAQGHAGQAHTSRFDQGHRSQQNGIQSGPDAGMQGLGGGAYPAQHGGVGGLPIQHPLQVQQQGLPVPIPGSQGGVQAVNILANLLNPSGGPMGAGGQGGPGFHGAEMHGDPSNHYPYNANGPAAVGNHMGGGHGHDAGWGNQQGAGGMQGGNQQGAGGMQGGNQIYNPNQYNQGNAYHGQAQPPHMPAHVGGRAGPVTLPHNIVTVHDALLKLNDLIRFRGGRLSSRDCASAMRQYHEQAAVVLERRVKESNVSLTALILAHPHCGIDRDTNQKPFNFIIDMNDHKTTTFLGADAQRQERYDPNRNNNGSNFQISPPVHFPDRDRGRGGAQPQQQQQQQQQQQHNQANPYQQYQQYPQQQQANRAAPAAVPGAVPFVAPVRFLPYGNHAPAVVKANQQQQQQQQQQQMPAGNVGLNKYGPVGGAAHGDNNRDRDRGRDRSRSRDRGVGRGRDRDRRRVDRSSSSSRSRSRDRGSRGARGRRGRNRGDNNNNNNNARGVDVPSPPGAQGRDGPSQGRLVDEASKVRGPCPDWSQGFCLWGRRCNKQHPPELGKPDPVAPSHEDLDKAVGTLAKFLLKEGVEEPKEGSANHRGMVYERAYQFFRTAHPDAHEVLNNHVLANPLVENVGSTIIARDFSKYLLCFRRGLQHEDLGATRSVLLVDVTLDPSIQFDPVYNIPQPAGQGGGQGGQLDPDAMVTFVVDGSSGSSHVAAAGAGAGTSADADSLEMGEVGDDGAAAEMGATGGEGAAVTTANASASLDVNANVDANADADTDVDMEVPDEEAAAVEAGAAVVDAGSAVEMPAEEAQAEATAAAGGGAEAQSSDADMSAGEAEVTAVEMSAAETEAGEEGETIDA